MRQFLLPITFALLGTATAEAQIKDFVTEVPQLALDILEESEAVLDRCWSAIVRALEEELDADIKVTLICGRIDSAVSDVSDVYDRVAKVIAKYDHAEIFRPWDGSDGGSLHLGFGEASHAQMIVIAYSFPGGFQVFMLGWWFEPW